MPSSELAANRKDLGDRDPAQVSIYNGMRCISRAVERHGRWTAFDADDELLGDVYPNCRAATAAIIAAVPPGASYL